MIVTLEGIDASGKATQAARLVSRLSAISPTRAMDFPRYQSITGQEILGLLTGKWRVHHLTDAAEERRIQALVLQVLMTSNRLEFLPLLKEYAGVPGKYLVNDRYYASGLVYGEADGVPMDFLLSLHAALPPSDAWIFLDIPPEESVLRRPNRRDEYEKRAGFMGCVRDGFHTLFRNTARYVSPVLGGQWFIVDGTGTPDEVHDRIWGVVQPLLAR